MITFGIFFAAWICTKDKFSHINTFTLVKYLGLGALPIALTLLNLMIPKRRGLIYGMRTLTIKHFMTVFKAIDCRIVLFMLFSLTVINGLTVLRLRMFNVFKERIKTLGPIIVWLVTKALTMAFFYVTT